MNLKISRIFKLHWINLLQVYWKNINLFKRKFYQSLIKDPKEVTKKRRTYLDKKQKQVEELLVGSMVYTIDKTKQSKWDATYEGPFTIVQRNRGGTYTLKDKTGDLLKRRFTIDMLKPVINSLRGGNDNNSKQPHYHVEKILGFKKNQRKQMYLVKWKGIPSATILEPE